MNLTETTFDFLMALLQIKRAFDPGITYVCNLCQSIWIYAGNPVHFSDQAALVPDFTGTVPCSRTIRYTTVKRYSYQSDIKS
jgi:hypothetical protein